MSVDGRNAGLGLGCMGGGSVGWQGLEVRGWRAG